MVPSGKMAMSQALISDSDIGLPSPEVWANAGPALNDSARMSAHNGLCIDMLDLPFAVDAPAGDAVVVLVRECERARHRPFGLAARGQTDKPVATPLAFPNQHYNSITSWGIDNAGGIKHVYA